MVWSVLEICDEAGSEVQQSPRKMPDGVGSNGLLVRVDSPQASSASAASSTGLDMDRYG